MKPGEVNYLSNVTAQILRQGRPSKPFLLRIEGRSMLPLISPGSVVKVEPFAGLPRIGDVVVRLDRSNAIAHRVVCQRRPGPSRGLTFVTKGDNALRLDSPCGLTEIFGIVRCTFGNSEDGKLYAQQLPRFSGLWIARLSCLVGFLSRTIDGHISGRGGEGVGETLARLALSLSHRVVTWTIRLITACDFTRSLRARSGIAVH